MSDLGFSHIPTVSDRPRSIGFYQRNRRDETCI